MISKHFRLRRILLGLAFAAIAGAPAAQATPETQAGLNDGFPTTEVCAYERAGAIHVLPAGMTLSQCSVVLSENSLGAAGSSAAGAFTWGEPPRTTIPLPGGGAAAD
jgi:hypothetical protein